MAYSTWTMLDGIYRFAADFATYEYQLIVGILQLTVSVINMNAAMMVIFYINDLKHNQKSHPERQPSPSAPRQTGEYTAVPVNE